MNVINIWSSQSCSRAFTCHRYWLLWPYHILRKWIFAQTSRISSLKSKTLNSFHRRNMYSLQFVLWKRSILYSLCIYPVFMRFSLFINQNYYLSKKKNFSWKHFNRVNWHYWSLNNEQRIGRTCGFLFIRVGLEVICELVVVICSKLMSY